MKDLKEIQGKKIQKVKQVKDAYSFELYKDKKKSHLIIIPDKGLFITKKNYKSGLKEDFCNILRKYLTGQVIEDVKHHEFDRVVEIETQDYKLVIEIFSTGNLIIINKSVCLFRALKLKARLLS